MHPLSTISPLMPRLIRAAARIVGPSWAEDAVQNALLRAWERWDQYDPARDLTHWIFAIVRNAAMDIARHRAHEAPEDAIQCEPQAEEQHREDVESTAILREELAMLPSIYREAITHTAIHGKQSKDYAHEVGQNAVTIRWRTGEGRRMLRERLVARGVEP